MKTLSLRSPFAAGSLLLALSLTACGPTAPPSADSAQPAAPPAKPEVAAVDVFLARLASHCGQAFAGRILADEPPQPDNAFAGKPLIMHVRECGSAEIKIPFHVGEDRSRTWVLTRTPDGLRLKHDHRHADGSDDELTLYGGDTAAPGTEVRQAFPVDAYSIEMFERLGYEASVTNTWAMEVEPGERFLYELSRPNGRLFQVEFDLSAPVAPPPAPWGHE
jgi:hypothetical protein